ncbi:MAG TPA: hypothetical protein VLV50_18550 [Stellaceae bacterium]|nr:hypothetical protein [Stellaceae bacterium]
MTEFGMLYLILVVVGFLCFVGGLAYGMTSTSPPNVGTHAHTEQQPFGVAHQSG